MPCPPASRDSVPGETSRESADATSTAPVVGLLLAAGRGSRFDPARLGAKLVAMLDDEAVALRAARRLAAVCDRVIVVAHPAWSLDPALSALSTALTERGLLVLPCPQADQGMGHSLAFGVTEARQRHSPRALVVALADMPSIDASTYRQIRAGLTTPDVLIAPRHAGKRGHPVGFGAAHLPALMALRGDEGAGRLLRSPSLTLIDVDDPGVLADVDTPEDLARTRGVASASPPPTSA